MYSIVHEIGLGGRNCNVNHDKIDNLLSMEWRFYKGGERRRYRRHTKHHV